MPVSINDIIRIELEKEEILLAVNRAKNHNFKDNLRYRHPNVSFDSKLRGYIGEIAVKKWLNSYGIIVSTENYVEDGCFIDIDLLYRGKTKTLDLELKTSLIPDADENLENVIKNRDIKLIRRGNNCIEELKSDVHIQIFFKQLSVKKDKWLKQFEINIEEISAEEIYSCFAADRYRTDTYLCAWIDKETLCSQIASKKLSDQKWNFGMREFWTCKLSKDAKKPVELIEFLSNI